MESQSILDWVSQNVNQYWVILMLMAVESSFIPFPSEVVIPPAAFVASDPTSALYASDIYLVNVGLIILVGTLGAMVGAIVNYLLAMWLGRPIIYKFADSKLGHLCLLSGQKVQVAEDYFNDHGKVSTFVGRLIPAVRQLISIPAGLSKMNFWQFLLYTFIGAFSWNCVLAALGYVAHGQMDLIKKYSHELSVAILVIVGVVAIVLIAKHFIKRKR